MIMKYSRQRAAILSFLQTRKDHPSAEVVYSHVKEEYPNISLGTVYRNLTQLADNGMILRLSFGELGIDHFDADTSPHHHFICSACNSVIDLELREMPFIDEEAGKNFDGMIQGHNIYFYGLCKCCLEKKSHDTKETN